MSSSRANRSSADMNDISEKEIRNLYAGATREVEESVDDIPQSTDSQPPADFDTVSTLRALIELAPFTNFVMKQSVIRYSHKTLQGRISKYEEDHKWVAGFCHLADLALRLMFTALLVVLIVAVVYKTVMPLPGIGD